MDKHFEEVKKEHTRIKHEIFRKTLRKSLYIANFATRKNPTIIPEYLYIDFFAGSGEFGDGSKGSPLIALEVFNDFLENFKHNNFEEIVMYLAEKKDSHRESLTRLINMQNFHNIKIEIYSDWDKNKQKFEEIISTSSWGFLYADPYASELNLNEFLDLLKKNNVFKDIMILFNMRYLIRTIVNNYKGAFEKVLSVIGANKDEISKISESEEFQALCKKIIWENLFSYKDFVIGVALPIVRKGKVKKLPLFNEVVENQILVNTDYFYLVLATDNYDVADEFIKSYELEIEKYYNDKKNVSYEKIKGRLIDVLLAVREQEVSIPLYNFLVAGITDFYSWKDIVSNNYALPTKNRIIAALNALRRKNLIEYDNVSASLLYQKDNNKYGGKGDLNPSKIKSKKDLETIQIKVIR